MSPEEMASKELQQWRQAELKHDIEKIKSHELEMISLGSVFVMKTKKGEQVSSHLRNWICDELNFCIKLLSLAAVCVSLLLLLPTNLLLQSLFLV